MSVISLEARMHEEQAREEISGAPGTTEIEARCNATRLQAQLTGYSPTCFQGPSTPGGKGGDQ